MKHTLHWLNGQQNGISMLSFTMSAQWLKALKILSYFYLKKIKLTISEFWVIFKGHSPEMDYSGDKM